MADAPRHLRILRALWEHDPSEVIATLETPVLLVPADSGDDWSRARASRSTGWSRPDATCVRWFSPADHDVHVQHPVELGDVLHEWVRRVDGRTPRS